MTQDMKCDTKGVDEVRREIQPELSWKHPDVRGKTKSKSDQESKEQRNRKRPGQQELCVICNCISTC